MESEDKKRYFDNMELTDYILKPENRQYVDISLSESWGLSKYVAKSNGLEYVHRGVKSIDERIIITKDWKNKSYTVDADLMEFIQHFSDAELTTENLDLEKIVSGSRAVGRRTFGYFTGFMWGFMNLFPAFDMLKNNDSNVYYAFAASGALFLYGIYSAATANGKKTAKYNKFLKLIKAAENADYFIKNSISKEVFERIK